MTQLLPFFLCTVGLALAVGGFAWLARYVRRRGLAGSGVQSALAAYDEAFRVTAHESHHEIRAQTDRKAPILSPDGHWQPDAGPGTGEGGGPRRPGARAGVGRRMSLGRRVRRLAVRGRLFRRGG
ncbi:hypothetical protein [Streptomyces sp. NPDC051561]|uniref:hypothetical protein n=1 Tax=Streptomyces sp. NPDC051561 TaxID=3365658 RepID=UPI0037985BE5